MQLPSLSLVKLQRLLQSENDARDAAAAVSRRLSETNRALATAPASEHANIEAEASRLLSRQTDLAARHRSLADLNAAINHWLSTATGTLEYVKPAKAALQKGETISAGILRLRERIHTLANERVQVMQARIPIAELKAQAAAYVASAAERGKPTIAYGPDVPFRAVFNANVEHAHAPRPDIAAALAWLNPTALTERLSEEIDKMPPPPFTMSAEARAQKLIAIDAESLICEREEECWIEASEEGEGPLVFRRITANPLAVLCMGKVQRKAAKPEGKVERVKAGAA